MNVVMTQKIRLPVPKSVPLPTGVEVIELVKRAQQGDLYARDEVVRANMGYVHQQAYRMNRVTGQPVEDFIQEGVLGLFRAVRKFDESFGTTFLTYAASWIKQAMLRYAEQAETAGFEGAATVVIKYRRSFREYERLILLGLTPEQALNIVAEKNNRTTNRCSHAALLVRFEALRSLKVGSLDAPYHWGNDDGMSLLEFIPDNSNVEVESKLDIHRRALYVRTVIENLRPKLSAFQRMVLDLRILPKTERITLDEVGKIVGRTRERVRQVEIVVMDKIRTALIKADERQAKRLKVA